MRLHLDQVTFRGRARPRRPGSGGGFGATSLPRDLSSVPLARLAGWLRGSRRRDLRALRGQWERCPAATWLCWGAIPAVPDLGGRLFSFPLFVFSFFEAR